MANMAKTALNLTNKTLEYTITEARIEEEIVED